jgi:hypothetical protein
VYVPTYKVEELYDTVEDILEVDGRGGTNNIIMWHWNSVVSSKLN